MQKQIEAFENDLISASDLKKARERIESERSKLTEHIQLLESRQNQPETIRANIARHLEDITGTDRLKAKKSMSLLIDRIEVDAPAVSIVWRG
jgi:site-specific DNA recombinase